MSQSAVRGTLAAEMEVTRDYLIAALQALERLHDETGGFINRSGTAAADSIADRELRNYVRPTSLNTAYSQGRLLLEVAADQMMACVSATSEPIQLFGAISCLRALLEAAALA